MGHFLCLQAVWDPKFKTALLSGGQALRAEGKVLETSLLIQQQQESPVLLSRTELDRLIPVWLVRANQL